MLNDEVRLGLFEQGLTKGLMSKFDVRGPLKLHHQDVQVFLTDFDGGEDAYITT